MGSAYSEEFEVKVDIHQRSVLPPLLFATVIDVITEKARSMVNELLQRFSTNEPRPTDGPRRSFRWTAKRSAINKRFFWKKL